MLHHALVFDGDKENSIAKVRVYIADTLKLNPKHNPDISFIEADRFSVQEARELKERASKTPLGDRQVFVLVVNTILREAQNALLKLLEEPGANTYFVIVVPSVKLLLPTVRSRLTYGGRSEGVLTYAEQAAEFLSASPGARLKDMASFAKKKDRTAARLFLDALESALYIEGVYTNKKALKEVVYVRQYISDRSSSLKQILEHLAVTV